jgi:hypothetical protein
VITRLAGRAGSIPLKRYGTIDGPASGENI